MKTKLLLLLLLANFSIYAQYTNIPDLNFEKELIRLGVDSGTPDGKILTSKASALKELYLGAASIASLEGIQDFTSLVSLQCDGNDLTTLDVSHNKALTYLSTGENKLTSLDVSQNIALEDLYFYKNQISDIDLSRNVNLKMLNFTQNLMSKLDLNYNKSLTQLFCDNNLLPHLDLSQNTMLTDLICGYNQLTTLDVTNNPLLNGLYCNNNLITSLDLSQNPDLIRIECANNLLTSLNISKNPVTIINCENNKLTTLDISQNPLITTINCGSNELTGLNLKNGANNILQTQTLNFKNNPNLTCIQVDNVTYSNANWASKIDATANFNNECANLYTLIPDANFEQKLINLGIDTDGLNGKVLTSNISTVKFLDLTKSNISDLTGIQDFVSLTDLYCGQNSLTTLNISKNTALTTLDCNNNKITSLDVSNNIALLNLSCYSNQLTSLDVKANTALTKLDSGSNQYTSLDVSSNTALTFLGCNTSQLTTLDVSNNTALKLLDCRENKLTSLDVSKITTLTELYCQSNQLTILDVSKNKVLEYVNCSKNQLTTLDLSVNTSMVGLYAISNQLTSLNLKNGNNKNFLLNNYTKFTNNPNLTCIQVDDAVYSNANWATLKDANATYNTTCEATTVVLSDTNFEQKLIDLGIDTDGLNGKITVENVSSVTSLDLSNSNIKDLTGIEYFTSLTTLDVSNNQLTSLDVSNNLLLETLDASSNQLTTLDLSKNTKLTIVYVVHNPLVSLNLRNGNNANFILPSNTGKKSASGYTSFLGLTALSCIQVDDENYSNANWSNIKESTTVYANTCKNLGVDESTRTQAVIYPNPTKGELNIKNQNLEKANVYNTLGQLVKSFTLNSSNTDNSINLSGLPKGVYYIYLISGDAASAKKVIVE
ncbi:T9SS type A sorting domain-containing protein [Flavobacterium sp. SH_e]|uniref:leucine-rich repeat domain-containing protein n=1 Tax=Flavobacterium TaxID=237 RepID=UPI0021E40E42|nr:leucine-rich repeat domain-containing protein [Flavobacterium sp. SH_e]MCV2485799.1 T9SS type A sorting domain-containing protein [Flavobacterium sp. SH_e]